MINNYLLTDGSDLGEGPLWHPKLNSLFWFDINSYKMHNFKDDKLKTWLFSEPVSAAGWIDEDHLLVASASSLTKLTLSNDKREALVGLEEHNTLTRSNDGRADPWGGFWISTMGLRGESEAGSIYRFYKGELRQLHQKITVPNSICFSPDRKFGYFADTRKKRIWRQNLDQLNGWPCDKPEIFIDLESEGLRPDGSVCDSEGYLWNAQYGASRLARYSPNGQLDKVIEFPVSQVTCPAFGGDSFNTIFTTSAYQGLSNDNLKSEPLAGMVFYFQSEIAGLAEYQVKL